MESPSDEALVAAARRGDIGAFGALVHRHRDRHVRFAVRLLGNRDDAEDVMQAAFVRAHRHLDRCDRPAAFGSWLHAIVVNECRTFATRRGAREARLVRDDELLAAMPDRSPSADPALRSEIERALRQLPHDLREAFLLKHVEQLDYRQMAYVTGVGESALKMRVKRACDQLREHLQGVMND